MLAFGVAILAAALGFGADAAASRVHFGQTGEPRSWATTTDPGVRPASETSGVDLEAGEPRAASPLHSPAASPRDDHGGDVPKSAALQSFPEWRVGDPITKLTTRGAYPRWSVHGADAAIPRIETIQGRYWMNRAAAAKPGEFTLRQLRSMREGFAPQVRVTLREFRSGRFRTKWISKELHHASGNRGVPGYDTPADIYEVWPWQHATIDPRRHVNYEVLELLGGNL